MRTPQHRSAVPSAAAGRESTRANMPPVACWHIGSPDRPEASGGVVAFTADELDRARPLAAAAIGFHELMARPVPQASRVEIRLPTYRGKSLIPVLAWLAASRLGDEEVEVSWYLDKQQGPDSVHKLLEGQGWKLDKNRTGRTVRLHGTPPAEAALPEPRSFTAALGEQHITLAADYGVFSPSAIDPGTGLLLDVALRHPPVDVVADIGIGYGALAIGLVLNSVAKEALGTEVDCVALWLAGRNAQAHGVHLSSSCTPEPAQVAPTALTVCNVPTHINAEQTARFMAGLRERAEHGTLLAVVHSGLENRYTRHLTSKRLRIDRHPGTAHTVLEATRNR